MAAMLTLVGVADEVEARDDDAGLESERGALVVLSEDEFRQVIRRLSANEPQAA
jgi:hypothetical protein